MTKIDKELAEYYKLKAKAERVNKKAKIITITVSTRLKKLKTEQKTTSKR